MLCSHVSEPGSWARPKTSRIELRPSEVLKRGEAYLGRRGAEDPRADAEILLMSILGVDRAGIYARSAPLTPLEARSFGRALCQRCDGIPVQHLTGEQQFRHITLEVRPGVFIPRPETEQLVQLGLDLLSGVGHPPIVVDVGTGTGAVALSVKWERPDAKVFAVDLSSEAVWLAARNAERSGVEVEINEGDLLAGLPRELARRIDMVISNPPYITAEDYQDLPREVRADPQFALVGGTEVHGDLAEQAAEWLKAGGYLLVEIGDSQGREVAGIFERRFTDVRVFEDLAGRDRFVSGRLP